MMFDKIRSDKTYFLERSNRLEKEILPESSILTFGWGHLCIPSFVFLIKSKYKEKFPVEAKQFPDTT